MLDHPPWPKRQMRVTGPHFSAICRWECKYGHWFCVWAEKPVSFMAGKDTWTEARLPELKRRGLEYEWLE